MNERLLHKTELGSGVRDANTPASRTLPAERFETCCFVKLLENETLDSALRREARLVDVPHEASTFRVELSVTRLCGVTGCELIC